MTPPSPSSPSTPTWTVGAIGISLAPARSSFSRRARLGAGAVGSDGSPLQALVALRELLFQLGERLSRRRSASATDPSSASRPSTSVRRTFACSGTVCACAQGLLGGVELARTQLPGRSSLIELRPPAVELGGLPSRLRERCLHAAAVLRERALGGALRDRLLDALELTLSLAQLVHVLEAAASASFARAPGPSGRPLLRKLADIGLASRELALALADLRAALRESAVS